METQLKSILKSEITNIREGGLYKEERVLESPQAAAITVNGHEVINFCANNYLGLSSHPAVIAAAHKALDEWGYGLSSVRFICGTQEIHKDLEHALFLVEAAFANVRNLRLEDGLELSFHPGILAKKRTALQRR